MRSWVVFSAYNDRTKNYIEVKSKPKGVRSYIVTIETIELQ